MQSYQWSYLQLILDVWLTIQCVCFKLSQVLLNFKSIHISTAITAEQSVFRRFAFKAASSRESPSLTPLLSPSRTRGTRCKRGCWRTRRVSPHLTSALSLTVRVAKQSSRSRIDSTLTGMKPRCKPMDREREEVRLLLFLLRFKSPSSRRMHT